MVCYCVVWGMRLAMSYSQTELCYLFLSVSFFFFQAEDGIRDLVRSRGLGDVYKRQGLFYRVVAERVQCRHLGEVESIYCQRLLFCQLAPVSYTHLTLPTSDLV